MKGLHALMLALPFGLIGALLYEASLHNKTGVHTLTVKSKNDFSSATGLNVRPALLQADSRPLQPKSPKKK